MTSRSAAITNRPGLVRTSDEIAQTLRGKGFNLVNSYRLRSDRGWHFWGEVGEDVGEKDLKGAVMVPISLEDAIQRIGRPGGECVVFLEETGRVLYLAFDHLTVMPTVYDNVEHLLASRPNFRGDYVSINAILAIKQFMQKMHASISA
jgi:hypothetical protein